MKNTLLLLACFLWITCIQAQPGNGFICQDAACLSNNIGVTISNAGSPPTPPLSFTCGVTHNNIFYAFCPERGDVELNITPSNCTSGLGVQAIIYQTDNCSDFQELVCVSNGTVDPFTINFSGTPGVTYLLMIDGFSGDVCDFTVTGTGIADIMGPPNEPILNPYDDPLIICEGEQLDIEITNDDQECTVYFWEMQSGSGFITIDRTGSTATINAISEGEAVLCVKADNYCYKSEICIDVEVIPGPQIDPIDEMVVCDGLVNFCDYQNFFDPPLYPDPLAEGWSIDFYESFAEAETNSNSIQCPYSIAPGIRKTIFLRVEDEGTCGYSVYDFQLVHLGPDPVIVTPEKICIEKGSLLPKTDLEVDDVTGVLYDTLSYHLSREDAEDNEFELLAFQLDTTGIYVLWLRVATTDGCFGIRPLEIEVTEESDIELGPIAWQSFGWTYIADIELSGPAQPYAVIWEDGLEGTRRSGLVSGKHQITVSDVYGCEKDFQIFTPGISTETDFDFQPPVSLRPNPAKAGELVMIESDQFWEKAVLYDSNGNILFNYTLDGTQDLRLASGLMTGVYYLRLTAFSLTKTMTLMVW